MRRSKAPSVLNKAKRWCSSKDNGNDSKDAGHSSDPEDEQYNWGSRNHNGEIKTNNYENKRIFNIVWRDISNKKHKTWKGDGTLEVNNFTVKAILKDETGKYMGCSTKFNKNDIAPDFQMVIGGKEIEIQNEIKEEDELQELRNRQVRNRNWGEEEWISPEDLAEEAKKPKGGFKFKPILTLRPPEVPSSVEWKENDKSDWERNDYQKPSVSKYNRESSILSYQKNDSCKEFLCFISASELQQFLFMKAIEYYSSVKPKLTLENIKSLDIVNILKHICNHPSFINNNSTTNELMRHLQPTLPDWSEMGPFDSGKLEFVQYFLSDLIKMKPRNCIIIAENANVLNMLQGLCNFMNIQCFRLQTNSSKDATTNEELINEFCSAEKTISQVLLVNSIEDINSFEISSCCKTIIVFEDVLKHENIFNTVNNAQDTIVYYLVTAFSVEELILIDKYQESKEENLFERLEELVNISNMMDNDCCYLHSKIECNCFRGTEDSVIKSDNIFAKEWKHFKQPFDVELLKMSLLENSAENIVSIFCKNHSK
ncbi:uncharacterized protein LOC119608338 [Lucilia sericata]|uniref:uncharacterized protein LOC119608338 n=1 Tax=Lucilia sericata TaxID=13632 RepID=UPI0018A86708|nr:uncharacterized protein LOC119608338 [Lucilia sericata]